MSLLRGCREAVEEAIWARHATYQASPAGKKQAAMRERHRLRDKRKSDRIHRNTKELQKLAKSLEARGVHTKETVVNRDYYKSCRGYLLAEHYNDMLIKIILDTKTANKKVDPEAIGPLEFYIASYSDLPTPLARKA